MPTHAEAVPDRELSSRRKRIMVVLGAVILVGIVNLFIAVYVIPRFDAIFRDMLGDRPLPVLTATVLSSRWLLMGFDCVCMLVSVAVRRNMSLRFAYAIFVLLLAKAVFTIIGLFLPLIGIIHAMSGSH